MYFYVVAICFVKHLGNLVAPAFQKSNMVQDHMTEKTKYLVSDEKGHTKLVSVKVGMFLLLFGVISSLCMIAISIMSLFYSEKWWYGLLTCFITIFLISPIYCKIFRLTLFSVFFYIELITIPFLIYFTNYYLTLD